MESLAVDSKNICCKWGERWDSNPRQPGSQPGALPTELRSPKLLLTGLTKLPKLQIHNFLYSYLHKIDFH